MKRIEQLAKSLGRPWQEVAKVAQQILAPGHGRDRNDMLNPGQCVQIERYFEQLEPGKSDNSAGDQEPSDDSHRKQEFATRRDVRENWHNFDFGAMNHGIWFHPSIPDSLEGRPHLKTRLGIVLQHLAAHGKTSQVKGCKDDKNRGWLRSPLGGNGGMQFYLWWSPQGSPVAESIYLPQGNILVRAVRHHDDHDLLLAGETSDYLPLSQLELEDESVAGSPWTQEQLSYVNSDEPVRIVLGRPGSGKTTVLWKSIEARSGQRFLYLTWSRELTQSAKQRFSTFAPKDVSFEVRDFVTFLSELCGGDVERQSLLKSQERFEHAISEMRHRLPLGVWAKRPKSLFAEVRAFLLGRAIPNYKHPNKPGSDIYEYMTRRVNSDGIDKAAAISLVAIAPVLADLETRRAIFPELNADSYAIDLLREDKVPDGFTNFDRIVVDEVQDLTLMELAVVIELCRAIARRRGEMPFLLMAGDEGQTVRPSGFEWASLNDLLTQAISRPVRFQLEDNLRCPQHISNVIERASTMYASLEKGSRPRKQGSRPVGQHVEAFLFHVDIDSTSKAITLLEELDGVEGVVVVTPSDEVPPWVPDELRDMIMTPAETKGLEFQSVCVLNPGRVLARMDQLALDKAAARIEESERRTMIDQLRVTLSRATETLAFIDVEATDVERKASWKLLGDAAPFDAEDLPQHFTDVDVSAEQRVLARTGDARLW